MKIAKVKKVTPEFDSSRDIYNVSICTKESYEFIKEEFKNNFESKDIEAFIMIDAEGEWMVGLTIKNKLQKKKLQKTK